ncbi:MAG: hypothetical protein LBT20_03835, partial [Clostridiales bacterium]|nr:hypothetical protein [Clostridiales bacterium]
MKNLSSKKTMRWAVILIMILTLVFSLASCGPTDTDEDPDTSVTTTNLFANGDFKEFSGTASPFSPTSWSDSVSDTDEDAQAGILSGVINTGEAFLKDRKTWTKGDAKNIANPTTNHANATADPYVLMIYNSISAAKYYYESFTAAAAKYYKVTVDVKVPAGSTAHVRLRGNTLDEIVVDSSVVGVEWNTYTFYIQSHSSNSKSVQLELWNGSSGTGYGATGAVFFDTASATELTADEWADVTGNNTGDTHFVSMKLPNPNFDNSTSVYNESYPAPITPSDYTSTAGTSKDTSKANASGGSKISYGIVRGDYKGNTSLGEIAEPIGDGSDPSFVPPTPFTTVKDFVLMLRNRDYTAYGYKANSTNTIRIERGQFYAISVWVKTVDLLSVAYTPYPSGPYFKNSDGVYTQIYSSFSVAGEYALAIRNNAYPTIDGSTT